ncbi:multidrug resistance-associated protein 4-like [Actinia tenebrosa]|uniref:Multidrug resistance-associated protein 4-like n=1 Tax=Actinia tenebrosa TaxID=6105 RepID=A0A6P8IQ66_ACTTE|nr:multidrug resistance-associated protein 4-like [Actinia tenebrosa]
MDLSKDSCSKKPKEEAGFFSLLFLSWMNNLLYTGYKRPLQDNDLHELSDDHYAEEIAEQIDDAWEDEVMNAKNSGRQPRLWRAVLKIFPLQQYVLVLVLKFMHTAMGSIFPVLLWFYLRTLKEDFQHYQKYATLSAAGISVAVLIRVFAGKHHDLQTRSMAINLKVALIGLIHKKSQQVTSKTSCDVQRMEDSYMVISSLIMTPFIIVMSLGVLLLFVGWQSLCGVILLLFFVILSFSMAKKYATLRRKQAELTDQRLGILNEIVSGIRAVKTYAWEQSFMNLIKVVRRKEIDYVVRKTIFYSLNNSAEDALNDVTTLIAIVALIYSGIHLFSYHIFTMATIFQNLANCMAYNIDYCYRYIQDIKISLQRIEKFLLEKDLDFELELSPFEASDQVSGMTSNIDNYMILKGLSAAWSTSQQNVIHDITLKVSPHQLMVITGPVGSGKSSLLMAMQREIPITSGKISFHGKMAYVSQVPWTFSGTVRDNIVFGKTFDKMKYQRILDLSGLQKDMKRFPKGDLSMIGQRGVVLSGGQRSRVSLARAMYSEAEIVLLDDPLSAVDAKVGQQIFEKCVCEELSGSLRILVTHQLQYLPRADWIVIIKDGRIEDQGSYEKLKARGTIQQEHIIEVAASNNSTADRATFIRTSKQKEPDEKESCDLVEEEEEKDIGHVTWRLYWSFFRTGSNSVSILSFAFFYLFVQGTKNFE